MKSAIQLDMEIQEKEVQILDRELIAIKLRKDLDIAKLEFKSSLDKKEFSNEEKREFAASQYEPIKTQQSSIDAYKYATEILKIEVDSLKRQFKIAITQNGDSENE